MAGPPSVDGMRKFVVLLALLAGACGDDVNDTGGIEIVTHDSADSMNALSTFVLEYDPDQNCLFHWEEDNNGEPGTGGRVIVIWPEGHTAERRGDDVVVLDAAGDEVARTGVAVTLGGGGGASPTDHCDAIGAWIASPG